MNISSRDDILILVKVIQNFGNIRGIRMSKNKVIVVQNINITVSDENFSDYICITDIAKAKVEASRGADVVKNWLRNRATLEFLGGMGANLQSGI